MIKIFTALAIIYAGLFAVLLRGVDSLGAIFRTVQISDLMSGAVSGKVDRAIFEAIPRSPGLNGLAAGLLYRGLRDAGAQIRAGCGDWLFSMEELREDRRDAERIATRAKLLPLLQQSLAERRILLVAVPVPDKAEQLKSELCGISAEQSRWRTELWSNTTAKVDIKQIDLRTGWPQPGYWRTDTHWDSAGALFAAEALARMINEALGPGTQRVELIQGARQERQGDLARLADLTHAPRWLAPAAEYEQVAKATITRSGGLLDETAAPEVVLAGSSYSLNSGFLEYLQVSLHREVAQLSEAGGGFAGALLKLAERPDMLTGVKVVIWEWPIRSLASPLTDAELRFLAQNQR